MSLKEKQEYDRKRYEKLRKGKERARIRYEKKVRDEGGKECDTCNNLRPKSLYAEGYDTCNICLRIYRTTRATDKTKCVKCKTPFETAELVRQKIKTEEGNVCIKCYAGYHDSRITGKLTGHSDLVA